MHKRIDLQHIPVKVYRTENRLSVAAPMPGLRPEDVVVEVSDASRLILHGELRGELKGMKEVLLDEWNVGGYYRELDLPAPVDGELATVTYGNGVLVAVLPLAEQTRPARLVLTAIAPDRGERVGSAGNPVRPLSTEEHLRNKAAQHAEHGDAERH